METSVPSELSADSFAAVLAPINVLRLVGLWLAYRVALFLYNISPFHPLYRVPGPKLAAMSYLYEFWYDFVLVGKYTHEIRKMHEKYGPIVRINPEELHCNDPDFAEEIYPSTASRIRDKHYHFLNSLAGPIETAAFGTREHEIHRRRRNAISRFFSRQQMLRLEPEINAMAQKMCDKLLLFAGKGPIEMVQVFNCFTADTISQYAYGTTFGFLDQEEWTPNFKAAFEAFVKSTYLFRFVPIMRNVVRIAPYLAKYMGDDIARLMKEMNETIPGHITKAQQDRTRGRIFTELIDSSLPDEDKTIYRLSGEGWSLISAGTETTAATLSTITYYLLSKPECSARLIEELKGVDTNQLSWVELEKYPYLYGVIYEGIRLTYGVSTRLSRIARNETLRYQKGSYQYVVPPGTPIGMSSAISHHNEDVFPNSNEFAPERWIDAEGQKNQKLERYIMSFSKGTRQCIGMNLAQCELYLVTASLALRVLPRMKLHDTKFEDIAYDHDMLTPQPKPGARGVRATIE
ncbi:cytochrome P450 [Xylariaceae sp. FL0662B]|nr:cytochrome P450 [Xylariaceae sp. FL0662B]